MLKQVIAVGLLSSLGAASAGAHEAAWGGRGYAPPPAYHYNAGPPAPVYWYSPRYCPPKHPWKAYHGHQRKHAYYHDARRRHQPSGYDGAHGTYGNWGGGRH